MHDGFSITRVVYQRVKIANDLLEWTIRAESAIRNHCLDVHPQLVTGDMKNLVNLGSP